MSSNRSELIRLATERRVHLEELAEYTKRFKDLPEDEAEPIIRQCIEEIDKKYPMQLCAYTLRYCIRRRIQRRR